MEKNIYNNCEAAGKRYKNEYNTFKSYTKIYDKKKWLKYSRTCKKISGDNVIAVVGITKRRDKRSFKRL